MLESKGTLQTISDALLLNWNLFSGKRQLMVDSAKVSCPCSQTDVNVERCLNCPYLIDVHLEDAHPSIVCKPYIPYREL